MTKPHSMVDSIEFALFKMKECPLVNAGHRCNQCEFEMRKRLREIASMSLGRNMKQSHVTPPDQGIDEEVMA